MSKQVKRRRGTAAQNLAFTGAEAEIVTITNENQRLISHDNILQGGRGLPFTDEISTNFFNKAVSVTNDTAIHDTNYLLTIGATAASASQITGNLLRGAFISFEASANNAGKTGLSIELNSSTTFRFTLKKRNVSNNYVDLTANELVSGRTYLVIFNTFLTTADGNGDYGIAELLNPPLISAADLRNANINAGDRNVKSDWNATSGDAEILNKPNIAEVARTQISNWAEQGNTDLIPNNKLGFGPTNVFNWALATNTDLVPTSKLGTGTANTAAYLAGDGTWKALSTISETISSVTAINLRHSNKGITLSLEQSGAADPANTTLDLSEVVYNILDDMLVGGSNITITDNSTANTFTFASAGSGSGDGIASVISDATLTGDGTSGTPLRVSNPFTAAEKTKLTGIATGAEVNVKSDWTATTGDAEILNKPNDATIGDIAFKNPPSNLNNTQKAAVRSAIDAGTSSGGGGGLAEVTTDSTLTGDGTSSDALKVANPFTDDDETKLDGIATGAEVNVKSDWNATSGDAEILNKPDIFSGAYSDLTGAPTIPTVPARAGAFTAAFQTKLEGIDAGANVNPTDAQIGDKAFSNPPSDLTDDEKALVRTRIGAGTGSGGGGSAIKVEDEGTTLTSDVKSLNFVGAHIQATDDGSGNITITVSSAGGGGRPIVPSDHFLFGLSDNDTPVASELTITAMNGTGTIPVYSGSKHWLIARLASEDDISAVYTGNDTSINQIGAFTKFGSSVSVSGTAYNVWVSNRALDNGEALQLRVS